MDKERLLAAIDTQGEHAYGDASDGKIARFRASLIEAYLGFNNNPAPQGRSQVVDRSVFETISTMLPSLVRIYAGSSDEVVKFMPIGPEDELGAEQTTAYINHIATQKNQWEQFVADWIHDAMLLGNGYAMAYWDDSENVESETYEGQTEEQMAMLVQDGATIKAHSQRPDTEQDAQNAQAFQQAMMQYQQAAMMAQMQAQQTGQPPQLPPPPEQPKPAFLHDVTVERNDKAGKVKLCVLPPEHCLVGDDTPDWTLERADYFEYRQDKTIAALRDMGLDVPEDIGDAIEFHDTPEDGARNRMGENAFLNDNDTGIMRKVTTRTIWVRADCGEGAKLYYCIVVGRTILYVEPVSRIHVVSLTPQPMPHRHPGMSISEMVLDLQEIKTAIKRGGLDNLYLANNGRYAISDKVNLDDFLDSRPGGVIRLHDGALPGDGHVFPMTHPFAFDQIIGSMEYFDQERQNRSGASRYFAGTDAGSINKTASGIAQLTNSAAQRVEHIARMFAPAFETLFNIVHELISKHQQKADVIKLKGKWVNVNPSDWSTRRDVKISVGVGAGNKDAMLAQLSMQLQEQVGLIPVPGLVKPENIYATVIEKAKLQGFSNPMKFYSDPTGQPTQQQQPPPEVMVAQMKIQAEQQAKQAEMQADAQKTQVEAMQAERQAERDMAFQRDKAQQDALLEKYKAELAAQTQLQIKQMEMGQNVEVKAAEFEHQKEMKAFEVATTPPAPPPPPEKDDSQMVNAVAQMAAAVEKLSKPKTVIRDKDGRVTGVQSAG